jgi:type II secretory pathway pseudopilin PulG
VELAVVIGILSALSAVVYPITQAVINHIHRAKAASNLRLIALAHAQFISDFGRAITFSDVKNMSSDHSYTANNFAAFLAKYGYIDDVSVWAWDFDYKVKAFKKDPSKTFPTEIYNLSLKEIHTYFKTVPLSVVCGVVQCPNFDYKTLLKGKFPAAYSRGLQNNGSWSESSSNDNGGVFDSKGGLIAYYDGSVEWCPHTINKFVNYLTKTETSQICKTIPNSHQPSENPQYVDSNFLSWTGHNACDI